jgi:putative MATE family efflux protein
LSSRPALRDDQRPPPPAPRLLPLAVPLFAEMALAIGMGLVGTVLAARLGDAHGAAFALCNQVLAMLFVFFRIIGAGVGVVVAQALGGNKRDAADAAARATWGASSWIGGICMLLAGLFAAPLLRLLHAPPEVLPLAVPLLQLMAPAVLLDAWNSTAASVLRSHLHARPTLLVNLAVQVLHLALAVPLMAGMFGWGGWGLAGYAVALLAARATGLGLFLQAWRTRLGGGPRGADWWQWRRRALAPVLHIGLPGAAENLAWRGAYVVSIAVVGSMGTLALATHAYAMQLIHFILLFAATLGLAAEIMVGHLVGAGRLHQANQLVRRLLGQGLLMALGVSLAAALAGRWLMGWFSSDAHIIATGAMLLWLTIALETGRTFNLVLVNALRAAGDARFPVQAGVLSFALVMAGGSWLLGVHLGWGLVGVWVAYAADEWLRGLVNWWRWSRLGWLPAARQMHRRLHHSRRFH